ncbi:MAG TPA: pyridoxal-dependent decarboxylase, exosortase A system-associated [Sphingomicrobium sp.]|nr:pyridoxal-dependent decarboxylase, exosortase A system-associated [Sphingomicrobium sp.]
MKAAGLIPNDFHADSDGALTIGRWRVEALASEEGPTPIFAYDSAIVAARIARFRKAMPEDVALHYAVKANPFAPLLRFIAPLVDGFDIASIGELERLHGVDTKAISFAGPAKSDAALEAALCSGITVNLESEQEAERALALAERMSVRPSLAVRVNPPFGLKGAGMKMGGLASPFGIDHDRVPALVRRLIDAGADWRGFHIFCGSQALQAEALIETQRATIALAGELANEAAASPPAVNLGGGFGIPYFPGDQPLDIEAVGAALRESLRDRPQQLETTQFSIELGRWLVGEAGVYLTRIVERKVSRGRTFLITDGGLHHMLAASGNFGQLLRRNYPIAIAPKFSDEPEEEVTVTGCLCTPLDLLADSVRLPRADVGDIVAIFCAGAYGLSASPISFLSQPAAREILV